MSWICHVVVARHARKAIISGRRWEKLEEHVREVHKGMRWQQQVAQGILPLILPHSKNVIKQISQKCCKWQRGAYAKFSSNLFKMKSFICLRTYLIKRDNVEWHPFCLKQHGCPIHVRVWVLSVLTNNATIKSCRAAASLQHEESGRFSAPHSSGQDPP